MRSIIRWRNLFAPAVALACVAVAITALAENIDPNNDQSQYAWGESVGWINFEPASGGAGVDVGPSSLTGYAWGESIGWISMNCSNTASCGSVAYGVTNNGAGTLAGYAWSESKGWISFSCSNTGTCGLVNYGVTINPANGEFAGHAWGEGIGWISFNCDNRSTCTTVPYDVQATSANGDNDAPGGPFGGTQAWITDGTLPEGSTIGGDATDTNDDNNGCSDTGEPLESPPRNSLNPWDWADMAVPARPDGAGPFPGTGSNGPRNGAITLADVAATKFYVGAANNGPPNVNGVDYDSDKGTWTDTNMNGMVNSGETSPPNGVEDGAEYDRTPMGGTTQATAFSGPPSGAVTLSDVSVVLAQVSDVC